MTQIFVDLRAREKCRANFKNHLFTCFKHINLPSPTQIQYDIADCLQNGWHDLIIEGFRGLAKSTITGCYATWRFDNDPENYQLLELSCTQTEACKFLKFTRNLLDIVPFLNYLRPDSRKQRDSALQFDVAPAISRIQPSCKALGIFGALTGNRAVEIIADDIETSTNCDTFVKRENIRKAITEFSPILRPLKGRVLYLGTPHTEESIYKEEAAKGTTVQIFPIRYPTQQEQLKYNGNLANILQERLIDNPLLIGQPTDPLRFDEETIIKEEAKGRSKFMMQYMLDNSLSDIEKYPLKCSDLIVMDVDKNIAPEKVAYTSNQQSILKTLPCYGLATDRFYEAMNISDVKWIDYTFKVMAIDPSGRGKDELAYCVLGVVNGWIYLLKSGGLQGGYCTDNLQQLTNIAKDFKVNKIVIESNFGDGMFTTLLQQTMHNIYACELEEVRNNTQKERRIIDTLEPVMNQHRLVVDKKVIEDDKKSLNKYPDDEQKEYSLFYQMTHLTKDKGCLCHDDRLDVLAMGVQECLDLLVVDVEEAIRLRQEADFEAEIERIYGINDTDSGSWFDV